MFYKLYTWILSRLASKKRAERVLEMERHIIAIRNENGCVDAMKRFGDIKHLHEHYRIALKEAGFEGSMRELWSLAEKSKSLREDYERNLRITYKIESSGLGMSAT